MDWLKQNYDRALLIAAALILMVCSGLLISNVVNFPEQFKDRNSTKPKDNSIKAFPIEALKEARARVTNPGKWGSHEGSLFISRPYVLLNGELVDPIESPVPLHPPISNTWLVKNNLPYWLKDVAEQDPDGDRFSNLEEFQAGTNPNDPKSVPPYYTKLRYKKFISIPFRLRFTGSPDGGRTFAINPRDRGGRTQFLTLGDMIKGTSYKLISYTQKKETRNEIDVDTSELTIQNTDTGKKLVLVANKETNDPTSVAEFLYLYDGSTFKKKTDDTFTLQPEPDRVYKLIDINEREATIEDQKTKDQYKLPLVQ